MQFNAPVNILPQTGECSHRKGQLTLKKVFLTIQCSESSQGVFIDKNFRKMSLALIGLHFVQLEKVTSNNQGTKMLKISTCRTRYILQCVDS